MNDIAFEVQENTNKVFFTELPFGHIAATYFVLIKLPKMLELKKPKSTKQFFFILCCMSKLFDFTAISIKIFLNMCWPILDIFQFFI